MVCQRLAFSEVTDMPKTPDRDPAALQREIRKQFDAGDFIKGLDLAGELVTLLQERGDMPLQEANRTRLEIATKMISAIHGEIPREKVTLSLRADVSKALRLASAETGKDMSEIVTDALVQELRKYEYARQALQKPK
jgi:hypothetical protein